MLQAAKNSYGNLLNSYGNRYGPPWDVWAEHSFMPDGLAGARAAVPHATRIHTIVREPRSRFASGFSFYGLGRCGPQSWRASEKHGQQNCFGSRAAPLDSADQVCALALANNSLESSSEAYMCDRRMAINSRTFNSMSNELAGGRGMASDAAACSADLPDAERSVQPSAKLLALLAEIRRADLEVSEWRFMLTERMDESLALLSLDEGLDAEELANFVLNVGVKDKARERGQGALGMEQADALTECWHKLERLDYMIYEAAKEHFERRIVAHGTKRVAARTAAIREASSRWIRACAQLTNGTAAVGGVWRDAERDPAASVPIQCWLLSHPSMKQWFRSLKLLGFGSAGRGSDSAAVGNSDNLGVQLSRDALAAKVLPYIKVRLHCTFSMARVFVFV